jgi:hypothetical protein
MSEPNQAASVAHPPIMLTLMEIQASAHGAQLCALGFHAWVPWLTIRHPDDGPSGRVLRYETFCTRCKHPEQFDV